MKQSLTGNEVVVAQMAKMERYRLYELPEDKIREDSKKQKCYSDDCWSAALPLTNYCKKRRWQNLKKKKIGHLKIIFLIYLKVYS